MTRIFDQNISIIHHAVPSREACLAVQMEIPVVVGSSPISHPRIPSTQSASAGFLFFPVAFRYTATTVPWW